MALAVVLLVTVILATSEIMDRARLGLPSGWQPWVLEGSAGLIVLVLLPVVFWFHERWPLSFAAGWLRWLTHALAVLAFTVLHFFCMNGLRAAVFPILGDRYDLSGSWAFAFLYESRKMLLVYLLIVVFLYFYRFTLARLQGEASFPGEAEHAPERPRERFLVKMLNREFFVDVADISWIQAARNYALLNVGERSFPIRQTMASLESELAPLGFERVHRSAIVNMAAVAELQANGAEHMLTLKDGTTVPVSATRVAHIRSSLGP